MTAQLPSVLKAKDLAQRLRAKMAEDGTQIGHGKSLELVAHQHGFRDWNAFAAAAKDVPANRWATGDQVSGTYLSQRFTARVIAATPISADWTRIELQLDSPIDVVTSEAFSNFRRRLRSIIGPKGYSKEHTSDGQPHLQIDLS